MVDEFGGLGGQGRGGGAEDVLDARPGITVGGEEQLPLRSRSGLARGDTSAIENLLPERAGVAGESLVQDIPDLSDVTTRLVRADPERQLSVRIRRSSQFHLHFIFDDGAMWLQTPSARRVDCHISADAVAFLMVFWKRQGQWRVITKGQLTAWGRKPWLALRFRSFLVNP